MHAFKNRRITHGITLIELLIVLAIIGVLAGVIMASFGTFRSRQALSNTVNIAAAYLTEARSRTLAGVNNTNYSVRFESDRLVLFAGSTYDSNASTNEYATYDVPIALDTTSLHNGGATITFDRLTGTTSDYGTLIFTNGSQSQTISISSGGSIAQ